MNSETLVQAVANSTFWEANFWGIIGSITGIVGLIVSLFSLRYNTPDIEIEELVLLVPKWVQKDWGAKSLDQLKNSVLEFSLEIVVRNRRGGNGSIRKPTLVVSTPLAKSRLIRKWETFRVDPVTEHFEMEPEQNDNGMNYYRTWTERHGRSFNLSGGERVDDKLTYQTYHVPERIKQYAEHMDEAKYYIEFVDNRGKHHKVRVTDIRDKRT